jgi:hypothetical protein
VRRLLLGLLLLGLLLLGLLLLLLGGLQFQLLLGRLLLPLQ